MSEPESGRGFALERLAAGVLGLYLIAGGILGLAHGRWVYASYLRLPMPTLLAIAVGAVLILLASGRVGSRARRPPRHL